MATICSDFARLRWQCAAGGRPGRRPVSGCGRTTPCRTMSSRVKCTPNSLAFCTTQSIWSPAFERGLTRGARPVLCRSVLADGRNLCCQRLRGHRGDVCLIATTAHPSSRRLLWLDAQAGAQMMTKLTAEGSVCPWIWDDSIKSRHGGQPVRRGVQSTIRRIFFILSGNLRPRCLSCSPLSFANSLRTLSVWH